MVNVHMDKYAMQASQDLLASTRERLWKRSSCANRQQHQDAFNCNVPWSASVSLQGVVRGAKSHRQKGNSSHYARTSFPLSRNAQSRVVIEQVERMVLKKLRQHQTKRKLSFVAKWPKRCSTSSINCVRSNNHCNNHSAKFRISSSRFDSLRVRSNRNKSAKHLLPFLSVPLFLQFYLFSLQLPRIF